MERTEDDRGDEVVVTEIEYQVCERCGSRRTTGENKEVRSKPEEGEESGDEPPEVEYEEPEETEDAVVVDGDDDGGAASAASSEGMAAAPGRTTGSSGGSVEEADYRCPDCGHASAESSLREGDVCPECSSGYLESI